MSTEQNFKVSLLPLPEKESSLIKDIDTSVLPIEKESALVNNLESECITLVG